MSNNRLDELAYPTQHKLSDGHGGYTEWTTEGLTKRERACIDLRIPESGNAELDALIVKAQGRDLAAMAMQGFCAIPRINCQISPEIVSRDAARLADVLFAELAKETA